MTEPSRRFLSIASRGIDFGSLPMRLFQKGNRLSWDAASLDFSRDAEEWEDLTQDERDLALRLATSFAAGEEAVTRDIQPFIRAMAVEGRLEDEMYLTQFAYEESRHMEGFRRWLDAVEATDDLSHWVEENPGYQEIFGHKLPAALNELWTDHSSIAQVRAAATYNQVVEGVLAMTGYHAWRVALERRDALPGVQELVGLISRDERRHMAWGTFLCRQHVLVDSSLWTTIEATINDLLPAALSMIEVSFEEYERTGRDIPWGVSPDELMEFATSQFNSRLQVIEAARLEEASPGQLQGTREEELEAQLEEQDLTRV